MTTPIQPFPLPPQVAAVLAIIQLALNAAPIAKQVYDKAKAVFDMWFKGGLITRAQQDVLMGWADEHERAVLAGETPPHFDIEPDPE